MRKISRTLALMGLLAPLGANALGIGDIRLHSALNQSLDAEIPLVLSGSDDITELRVTLAPADAFARAGIERHYSLSKLRFTPQQKADGNYVIKVGSQDSIREPILDFMIEVYWPQGRLQREFTVLLDPPASFSENDVASAELPETESYPRRSEQAVQRPAPEKTRRPAKETPQAAAAPQPPAEEVSITGTQYGPVGKNETLWSIAKRFNQNGAVSQEKMLQALYKANPQAFYKHSINALKAGETITIPDRETVARLSSGALAAPQTLRASGKLTAKPGGTSEAAAAETGAQGQLKLLAPSTSKLKGEAASAGGKGKAGIASEDIDTLRQEFEELRRHIADSDRHVADLERQLSLKNEQLATLQAQQKPGAKQLPTAVPSATQPLTPTQAPIPTAPPTSVEPVKPPTTAIQPVSPQQTTPVAPPAQQTQPLAPTTKPTEAPPPAVPPTQQPVPPPPPPAQVKKPVTPPAAKPPAAPAKEEEGLLAKLRDQPSYMFIGELTLLILSGVALMQWYKRRRAEMIDDTESILTLSDREKTVQAKRAPSQLDHTSGISEAPTTARSSFLSEFTPSDFDALGGEMEEVDPISEADVYLAYGRYKQAEELIRSAISQNPERDECKLKLLEIHYATENAQAFEKFAQELEPTHRAAKPEFWEKVVEMGQELCPGSALFGASGAASASDKPRPSPAATETGIGREEAAHSFQKKGGEAIRSAEDDWQHPHEDDDKTQADLTQDFFYGETTTKLDAGKGATAAEPDFPHFDDTPPPLDSGAGANRANETKEIHDKTLDDILAELGVLSEQEEQPPAIEATEAPLTKKEESNSIEFEYGGLERMRESQAVKEEKPSSYDEESPSYGEESPKYDAKPPSRYDEESPRYDDDASEYLALTEMDEQETKLDLAKAYFDMGDDEAARVILESVAENGNDAQKQEAWSLLNRITRKEVNSR